MCTIEVRHNQGILGVFLHEKKKVLIHNLVLVLQFLKFNITKETIKIIIYTFYFSKSSYGTDT